MQWLGSKILCVLVEVVGCIMQLANLFLGNIVIYEVTNGATFDYGALLNNPTFWFVFIFQVAYFILSWYVRSTNRQTDETVEEALRNGKIQLIKQVVSDAGKHNFVDANKVFRLFEKMDRKGR